jgi:hypothetical protein
MEEERLQNEKMEEERLQKEEELRLKQIEEE